MDIIRVPEKRTLPEIKLNLLGDRNRLQRFWFALKCVCWKYTENTQVHGFFYLKHVESKGFKRIFWSIVIVLSFLIGAYILAELVVTFFKLPIQITVGRPQILLSVPFPGISLCHPQTVISYKAKQFVDTIKIPGGYDKADIIHMLPTALGIFTENQWGAVDPNYLSTVNEILQMNSISVLDAVKAVGIKCPELVIRCSFNKKRFSCFQDDEHFTFRETISYFGVCCSFNYNPNNSSYEPININSYGVRGGLSIIGSSFSHSNDGTQGHLLSDGIILLQHPPHDFVAYDTDMTLLEVGKITSIGIYPTLSTISTDVEALPLKSRKCFVGSDVGLKTYRRRACAAQCLTQYIYEKCQCHPYFLPADDGVSKMRNCSVSDGESFQQIFYEMRKIRCSSCLPACEEIAYKMSTATISYSFVNSSINPMYEETNVTTAEFTAHIYFAGSTVPVKKTIISQSFIQLLSNFGGVFNLVLGISIFSIVELFYYFCYKIPQIMKQNKKVKPVIIYIQPTKDVFR